MTAFSIQNGPGSPGPEEPLLPQVEVRGEDPHQLEKQKTDFKIMNYPFWDVPLIGAGWVIGIISIFHVMISHFAVGGGLLIPILERRALSLESPEWMNALRRNMRFFLIVTGVLGTVSGVGIWFSIGLAQPTGTSALIHIFVFFWAIEWVFFLIELASAAVYYYSWGRISDRLHVAIGWVYCVSSFFTLFVINGILTFMMTPGQEWLQANGMREFSGAVLYAFFNPTYWPSLFIRALACLSLAAVFVLMSASRIRSEMEPDLKADILRYLLRWFIPGLLLLPIGLFWLLYSLPQSRLNLLKLSELNLMRFRRDFVSVLTTVAAFILVWLAAQFNLTCLDTDDSGGGGGHCGGILPGNAA